MGVVVVKNPVTGLYLSSARKWVKTWRGAHHFETLSEAVVHCISEQFADYQVIRKHVEDETRDEIIVHTVGHKCE